MKKLILTAAVAAIAIFGANQVAAKTTQETPEAGNLNVRIIGIREDKGNVMVALGDYTDLTKMVGTIVSAGDARNGTAECILTGKIDLSATLYAFIDTNGNFNLDLNERGIPTEGCAFGPVTLDENGMATIELKYFN